jgi:hypothetical protein
LNAPQTVIYHGGCTDGFTAAWVFYDRCRDVEEFYGATHGDPPPVNLIAGKRVAIVDFSYKRDVMYRIAHDAASLLVLDHHKSAERELRGFQEEMRSQGRDVTVEFDMGHSGARMAWDYFNPDAAPDEVPPIVRYVEDVDLWRFKYSQSKPFVTALRSRQMEFYEWDSAAGKTDRLVVEGGHMLAYHYQACENIIESCTSLEDVGGHRVPVVNANWVFSSDVGNMLLTRYPDAPFSASWFRRKDGLFQFSLRSEDSRVDVSLIASGYGGGGHRNAAGFQNDVLPW